MGEGQLYSPDTLVSGILVVVVQADAHCLPVDVTLGNLKHETFPKFRENCFSVNLSFKESDRNTRLKI